jgi:replication initiation and membrane attachment protein DnaB
MMGDKERFKERNGKVVHGSTPEERFKERHGITYNQWIAKLEEKFIAKTGMTYDEWIINRYESLTPVELLKEQNGAVSDADLKLINDLQALGINNSVINVLLEYVVISNGIGLVHSLVLEIGNNWFKEKILTIEMAISYVRKALNTPRNNS